MKAYIAFSRFFRITNQDIRRQFRLCFRTSKASERMSANQFVMNTGVKNKFIRELLCLHSYDMVVGAIYVYKRHECRKCGKIKYMIPKGIFD